MAEAIEHAIERLRTAFWSERDPEGRAFAPLADAYREKGDLPRALDIVQEGISRHPEYTSGHVVAGRVHVAMGSVVEAETCFRRALEFDPENTVALQAMGELAEARGGHAEAAEYFRRLATLNPSAPDPVGDSSDSGPDPLAFAAPPEESDSIAVDSSLLEIEDGPLDLSDLEVDPGTAFIADDEVQNEDVALDEIWSADTAVDLGGPEASPAATAGLEDVNAASASDSDESDAEVEDGFSFEVTDLSQGVWDSESETVDPDAVADLALADAAGLDPLALDVKSPDGEAEPEVGYDEEDDVPDDPVAYLDLNGSDEELVVEPVGEFLVAEALAAHSDEESVEAAHSDEESAEEGDGSGAADVVLSAQNDSLLAGEDQTPGGSAAEDFQALLAYQPKPRAEDGADQEVTDLPAAPADPEHLQPRDWTWTPLAASEPEEPIDPTSSSDGTGEADADLPIVGVESLAPDPVDIQELAPDEAAAVSIEDLAPVEIATSETHAASEDTVSEAGEGGAGEGDDSEEAVGPSDFQAWLERNRL